MADSDDEFDRKRRDKFRGERERGSGGPERERWSERDRYLLNIEFDREIHIAISSMICF